MNMYFEMEELSEVRKKHPIGISFDETNVIQLLLVGLGSTFRIEKSNHISTCDVECLIKLSYIQK